MTSLDEPAGTLDVPAVVPVGTGRSHGTSGRTPFDRWFRYPAGFASDYVAALLDGLSLSGGDVLVDPFAGSAVAGTAARARGMGFHGVEAHPLVAELGRLKLNRPGAGPVEGDGLPARQTEAAASGEGGRTRDRWETGPADVTSGLEVAAQEACTYAKELLAGAAAELTAGETSLVASCFSQAVLSDLVCLREAVRSEHGSVWQPYLKWALLATLRDVAQVKVGWPYQRPAKPRQARHADPMSRFVARAALMAEDLAALPPAPDRVAPLRVVTGDSRSPVPWVALGDGQGAGCLTSPPYLNNFDYADATRLELYFWTSLGTWREMCDTVRDPMLTATTQQSTRGAAAAASEALNAWPDVSSACDRLVRELGRERRARSRGKEYDQVLPAYLAGVGQVLGQVARVLGPGSPCVLLVGDSAPYGVHIDTPALLAALGQGVGLVPERDTKLRSRGARWTTSGRHAVSLSERMVVLRRE